VLVSRQEKNRISIFLRFEKKIEVRIMASFNNFTWSYRKNFGKFYPGKKENRISSPRWFSVYIDISLACKQISVFSGEKRNDGKKI